MCENPASYSPFGPTEISPRIQRTSGHQRYDSTHVPRQPGSPLDTCVLHKLSSTGTVQNRHVHAHHSHKRNHILSPPSTPPIHPPSLPKLTNHTPHRQTANHQPTSPLPPPTNPQPSHTRNVINRLCSGDRWKPFHRKLIGEKHERLVAKSDQQFIMNHQEHNRRRVWIDVLRQCYEMCHVLLCYVIFMYVLVCYRMLLYVIVTYRLSMPRPRL